jgi:hypothetical protein
MSHDFGIEHSEGKQDAHREARPELIDPPIVVVRHLSCRAGAEQSKPIHSADGPIDYLDSKCVNFRDHSHPACLQSFMSRMLRHHRKGLPQSNPYFLEHGVLAHAQLLKSIPDKSIQSIPGSHLFCDSDTAWAVDACRHF